MNSNRAVFQLFSSDIGKVTIPDDRAKRRQDESDNQTSNLEVNDWKAKVGESEEGLRDAGQRVGPYAKDVERQLPKTKAS
jgi:hypothetical protein